MSQDDAFAPDHDARPSPARALVARLQQQETLNFWLTNRIPRNLLTRLVGRFSRIRSPRLTRWSIRVWRLFADDLRLDESPAREFASLQECFTRPLKPGARPIAQGSDSIVSPCDAVIGANGVVSAGTLLQAKGMVYPLAELLGDADWAEQHRQGAYVTLRLKSSMYHRFHAPCAGRIQRLRYVTGEVYNVNPPALKRIQRLFCRNERAALSLHPCDDAPSGPITLVPVAAVLVSSMKFTFLAPHRHPASRANRTIDLDTPVRRGQELGWFEHGSTIIVLAGPGLRLAPTLVEGRTVRMGERLLGNL